MRVDRRAPGSSGIDRLPSGRWRGRIDFGTDESTGRRIRRTVTGSTRKEVAAKIAAAKRDAPVRPGVKTMTVGDAGRRYLAHIDARLANGSIRPKTAEAEYYRWQLVQPLYDVRLAALTAGRIELLDLTAVAPSTRRGAWMTLRRVVRLAIRDQLISSDPFDGLAMPSGARVKEPVAATRQDVDALLAASQGRWRVMFAILSWTGMRRGEVLALRWDDLDLASGTLRVREGKTDRARRTIPISPELREHLESWAEENTDHLGLMFPTRTGTQISGNNFLRKFKAASPRAALTPHSMRHGFVTNLLEHEVPVHVVSRLAGHVRAGFTLDHYAHSAMAAERSAVTRAWS